jgi:hypothetical protein
MYSPVHSKERLLPGGHPLILECVTLCIMSAIFPSTWAVSVNEIEKGE